MHGIAAHLADAADGRLARAHAADGAALPLLATQLHHRAEARDRSGPQFERGLLADEPAPLLVVGVGKQRRHRHLDKVGIAVEFFAIRVGELRALDEQMDELGARGIGAVEIEALEQRQLLEHHRALRPRARLADGIGAVVVGERRLDMGLPARHVLAGEHAAMGFAAGVHYGLGAAEAVDRLGDKALRPGLARRLDLLDAIAARALGLAQHARVGIGQRLVREQVPLSGTLPSGR